MATAARLIILSGLPGSGKTTVARELARRLGAVHIRIDTIEQALRNSGALAGPVNDAGYRVAYAVAEDNLRLGHTVIADSVNPLQVTRNAWRAVATKLDVPFLEVEVVCNDAAEHRARVEGRVATWRGMNCRPGTRWWGGSIRSGTSSTW